MYGVPALSYTHECFLPLATVHIVSVDAWTAWGAYLDVEVLCCCEEDAHHGSDGSRM
jgi:hypothetical protein